MKNPNNAPIISSSDLKENWISDLNIDSSVLERLWPILERQQRHAFCLLQKIRAPKERNEVLVKLQSIHDDDQGHCLHRAQEFPSTLGMELYLTYRAILESEDYKIDYYDVIIGRYHFTARSIMMTQDNSEAQILMRRFLTSADPIDAISLYERLVYTYDTPKDNYLSRINMYLNIASECEKHKDELSAHKDEVERYSLEPSGMWEELNRNKGATAEQGLGR